MTRVLIRLLLALVLATGSMTSVVLHGQMQGATTLVVCSDRGDGAMPATVTLDAGGRPIAARHACLDCLAAHAMALPFAPAAPVAPMARHLAAEPMRAVSARGRATPAASARGPPFALA